MPVVVFVFRKAYRSAPTQMKKCKDSQKKTDKKSREPDHLDATENLLSSIGKSYATYTSSHTSFPALRL
jgi:hypothetical protein